MKKILSLVLALCLVLTAVPGFAVELLSGADTYPLNSDKTITIYTQDYPHVHEKYVDWTESPFHTNLSKMVGVNIEWVYPTAGSSGAAFTSTLLADPDNLPNVIGVYRSSAASQDIDDGLIWDLTPYIQEYAPAYYAFLQTNPDYDKAMKDDQGRYYRFGFFREDGGWNDSYAGPAIRTDWLVECGLDYPKTISEFENVIRVFNEKYGAQFSFAWFRFKDTSGIPGAFGAYAGPVTSIGWAVEDGKVFLDQTSDNYRAYLSWLNKMWDEGLLDQDVFVLDDNSIKTKVLNGKVGISITSMGQITNWNKECEAAGMGADLWAGSPYPTADDGSLSSVFGGPGIKTNEWCISKATDEETMKLCLQVLDYAYTEEGFMFWNYGVEGDSWEMDENGTPVWTEKLANDKDNDALCKYVGAAYGGACIQATRLLELKNSAVAVEANNIWYYNYPDDMEKNYAVTAAWRWPVGTTFTTEEQDELEMLNTVSLDTFCSESFAAFVSGTLDVNDDAVWAKYLSDCETYNLSRITEIRQACYDRFIAR